MRFKNGRAASESNNVKYKLLQTQLEADRRPPGARQPPLLNVQLEASDEAGHQVVEPGTDKRAEEPDTAV